MKSFAFIFTARNIFSCLSIFDDDAEKFQLGQSGLFSWGKGVVCKLGLKNIERVGACKKNYLKGSNHKICAPSRLF